MVEIKRITALEGLLFLVGDDGIEKEQLLDIFEGEIALLEQTIAELTAVYKKNPDSALQLRKFGTKYKLTTKSEHTALYENYFSTISVQQLSNAALEVLAIIAYNQPITRAKIEDVRGVNSDSVLRKLQMFNLIEEVGRDEGPGMPILFGVSGHFLDYFGLISLEELPTLKMTTIEEIREDVDIFMTKYQEQSEQKLEDED
ncbi:MAG: SMC-Scp complex subunit ScpB [Culicoidibacterales bacterium]